MDETAYERLVRRIMALNEAIAAGAHDVGVRSMQVCEARRDLIEEAAWEVVDCEDDLEGDLEGAVDRLRKVLES